MVRPDCLSLLFHFAAFLLLYRDSLESERKRVDTRRLVLAGFLSAFAIGIKQTTLSLWLAYGLYVFLRKKWKNLFFFLLGALPPIIAVVLGGQWATKGMFLQHTFFWLDTGYDFKTLEYFLIHGFLREAGWLALGVGLTWWLRPPGLLLQCQILFSVIQLASLGRSGGAENYCLEFWLYGIFFLAEGQWFKAARERGAAGKWIPPLFALAACFFLFRCPWPEVPSAQTVQMKSDASQMYRAPGEYLALDLDLPLMAGRRIWYQPVEYQYLFLKSRWDPAPLIRDIRERKFVNVELYDIPRQYLLPAPVVDEIMRNYHVGVRNYGRLWLVPNEAPK